eukprot:CAMPEP_0172826494 /NCGR_PEP_ID=MMETSP1075-20121228/19452_1 /TAXON_ID=2916 /ORGANISM="Ceratium fusus, Strain PA161109" /LENGTH=61 /DNA_ID=CAMNT_0013668145 /DNA_START=30 /DNA_END=212 /DNA_ORIENTATION=+
MTKVIRAGNDAKIVCTTTLRFGFREITLSGRRARKIRNVLRKPPPPGPMTRPITETQTTMP